MMLWHGCEHARVKRLDRDSKRDGSLNDPISASLDNPVLIDSERPAS